MARKHGDKNKTLSKRDLEIMKSIKLQESVDLINSIIIKEDLTSFYIETQMKIESFIVGYRKLEKEMEKREKRDREQRENRFNFIHENLKQNEN